MEQQKNFEHNPVLVSHVGRRDRYELAYALSLSGRPVHLVTDFYYQPGTVVGKIARAVFGKNIYKRHRPDLEVSVHSSILLFLLDFVERLLPRNKVVNRLRGYALGRLCLNVVKKHGITDAYVYYNSGAYSLINSKSPLRVTLFQMHPHPEELVRIYHNYLSARPTLIDLLSHQEEELTKNCAYFDLLSREAHIVDRVLCTSSFVKTTLLKAGVPDKKVTIIPYGVERRDSPTSSETVLSKGCGQAGIKLAFIGQFVVRKGIYELVRFASKQLEAEIIIFSREADFAQATVEGWLGQIPQNVHFRRILDDKILWEEAAKCDFLILPSLAEGYGLVLSEAMGHGLPVIATRNSAAPDLIVDGENGFMMDAPFEEDITQAVRRALDNQEVWPDLRKAAWKAVEHRNWHDFRGKMVEFSREDRV